MDGEFRLDLKVYDPVIIRKIFVDAYQEKLQIAYSRSAFSKNAKPVMLITDFYAGYYTKDSLFLVYAREANILQIYIETANRQDINILKSTINEYFRQVIRELEKSKIKWNKPLATITLKECQFNDFVRTRQAKLAEIWKKQKEKLFIVPAASAISSFIAIYLNVLRAEELSGNLKKTLTLMAEAYIGLLLSVTVTWLFSNYKKQFSFNL
jgi:hypothetical protein